MAPFAGPSRRAAVCAFVAGILLTAVAVVWHARSNTRTADQQFAAAAASVTSGIGKRMRLYEFGLRGARGAVIAAGPERIDEHTYRKYALTRDLEREFPGVHGTGVIRRVAAAEEPLFVAEMRRDGRPDFAVRQLAPSEGDRFVIYLIEPLESNRAAVGLDIASETNRRRAAEASMRSGNATLTGPITLVQASSKPRRSFLLLLPIYRTGMDVGSPAARVAATYGWSYAPLIIDEVLTGLDLQGGEIDLSLRDVTDDAAAAPFFATSGAATAVPGLERHEALEVFGRRWEAQLRPTPLFWARLALIDPRWTALLGTAVSAVLAALGAAVARNRRRDAERRLSDSHRAAMVTASEDAIVGVSLDGRITSWNPAAERLFGLPPDQALGQPLDVLVPVDQRANPEGQVLARVARGEVVAPFETVRRRHDGQPVAVSISAVPLLAGGRIIGVAKTYRDISARERAEQLLRQSNAELETRVTERTALVEASRRDLRSVLDAMPSMVGAWDAQLRNRFANAAYASYFGRTPEEIAQMTLPELLGPELYARNEAYARRALAGEEQQFERDLPLANGQGMRHTLAHYLPYRENGAVAGFYVLVHDVTELKQSQLRAGAAMRKADALMALIQQHAIFSITDRGGRILDVNDAFCRISGYTHDELVGQTHRVVHSATQGPAYWVDVWRTIAGGTSWRGEVCTRAMAGSLSGVDSIIAPFVGANGKVENYISVRFDITTRKAAEAALAARERVMRLVIDAYPGVLAYWDAQMRCVFANRAYHEWLGIDPDRMIGRTQREILDDETYARNEALILATLRGEAQTVERHRVTAAGRAVDYLLHYVPDGSGADVQGFISATVDITERKRAEDEANRMAAQLRAVLDAATEVSIIAVGPDGKISLFNSGAERLLGYARAEVVGVETSISFHDRDEMRLRAQAMSAELGRTVRTGLVLIDEAALGVPHVWRYRRKDGSTVPVSLTVTAMLDADSRCIGYLGVAHDVSRQKQYEQSLQEAAEAAQRANLAKSQFLANMSHEIRTPLNALIGVGHLLAGTALDPDQRQLLAKSQVAGRSLMGIVNDVLDLAKIEAGELTLEDTDFQPREMLAEVEAMFRTQADDKGLAYEVGCADDVPAGLVGDPVRVRQILVNLVSNAMKFTSQGGVRVRVEVLSLGASLARLRCSVHDTGTGIAEDAQTRLFQPFSQADASTTRRYGGTGLGLSIVRQLAEAMGGEVGVTSRPGQGSEFWAVLSLALPGSGAAASLSPTRSTLEVLIVDDHLADRQSLASLSRALGWRACELDSGAALLALVEARLSAGAPLPDALIVDQQMAGMTGLQAVQQLGRAIGRERLPAVLVVSAHDRHEIVGLDTEHLVEGVLAKPVGPSDLFNAVNDGVARRTGNLAKVLRSTRVGSLDARWLAGVRVLVVDDGEINREVARRLLEREGAEVQTRNDGGEALEALRTQPDAFDVVVMDVQMAGMDGLEATRRLRSELGLTLPVVALTAGALVEERRRALDAGMTDFMTKPLDPHTLVHTLRRVVEARRGAPLLVQRLASKESLAPTWPAIEGIDSANAALRTANDPALLLSLVSSLVREFADLADPDATVPDAAPARQLLCARVHKLRGSSGTVGAREVHRLATIAEKALAQPGPVAEAAFGDLARSLRALFDAAAPFLAMRDPAARPALSEISAEPITGQECEELIARLRQQSMSAVDRFDALAPRLHATFGPGVVHGVRQALDELDFARALSLLETAG